MNKTKIRRFRVVCWYKFLSITYKEITQTAQKPSFLRPTMILQNYLF